MNATEAGKQSRGAVHGVVSTSTAAIVQGLGQLLVLAILARYVSKTDFGLVTATLVVIGLGRQLAEALVSPVLVLRENLSPSDTGTAATLSWIFGCIAVGLLWSGSGILAQLFSEPKIIPIIKVMAVVFLLQSPLCVAEGLVHRDYGYGRLAAAEMLSFLFGYSLVGVTLALLGAGVWALVSAYVAQVLVKVVYLLCYRPDALRLAFDPGSARITLRLAGGFGTAKLFNYAALQGDYAVVATTMNAAAVGVYGRAYQIVSLPALLLGQALERVLFPIYARLQSDRPRAAEHYSHSVAISVLMIAPASMLFVVLAPEIVRLILGPDWSETVVPLQILAASLLFRMGYKLNDPLTKGLGVVYARVWRIGIYAVAVVLGAFLGVPWGLTGVSIGVSVAIFINFLLMAQLALRLLNLSWREYVKMHVRGVVLAASMLPLAWGAASGLRVMDVGYFGVLCSVVILIGACWSIAALLRPDLTLGPDVQWLARLIGGAIAPPAAPDRHTRGPCVMVEFLGSTASSAALSEAVLAQLPEDIPVHHVAAAGNNFGSAIRALLRSPRSTIHQALILFSLLPQNGGQPTQTILKWLALTQRITTARANHAVVLCDHGMLEELLSLDQHGSLNTVVPQFDKLLNIQLPDVLILLQDQGVATEQRRAMVARLQDQFVNELHSILLLDHSGTEIKDELKATRISTALAARWKDHAGAISTN